eukprot:s3703_g4.t1
MGCCCLSHESAEMEEPLRIRANPGPPPRRRCTDFPCCILFAIVLVGNGILLVLFSKVGDLRRIDHGRDHDGNLCGLGTQAARAYAFYPDLETDLRTNFGPSRDKLQHAAVEDPSLGQRYGICLPGCPAVGSTVQDYGNMRQAEWLVLQPSFAVFGRCVPYQRPADQSSTKLCASPACEPIVGALPTKPQQVCGLTRDGTDKYWLLEAPDTSIEDGWRAEGADSAVISARATMAGTSKGSDCRQQLRREADVSIRPLDDSVAYNLLTSVTSPVYSVGNSISSNYALILGLGVGGSAVMSVIIMLLFPICAPPVLLSLLVVVFVALILADYVLFVQGGIASGRTGAQLQQLTQASSNQATMQWFAVCGCLLAVAIMLLACTVLSLAKQFRVVLALLSEAGNMIRRVPSLLALPMILLLSLALFAILLMLGLLGVATASQEQVASLIGGLNIQGDEAVRRFQQGAAGVLIVSFIWLYFFHVAIYHNTIALTVSRWYFRGDLQEHHMCPSLGGCLGGPVAISLLQAFRYHVGSLAFGALALTACTVPRLVREAQSCSHLQVGIAQVTQVCAVFRLEYVEKHAKETGEQNALAAAVRCATRCCLSWLHCCLQFVTEYAYMYVAVIGEPFCQSACKSFQLFTKYPAQVALNTLTSVVLGFLVCIGVPFALVLAAFFELRDSWVNFQPVAVCVIILAYIISRMSVGVYDAILTTLFICAMRDEEYCGGQHMGPELRQALQLRGGSREVECFERAIQLNPKHAYARTLLGHELVALEKYDKAIQQYRSAIDVDPRNYGAWWGLGRVCQSQDDLVQAKYNFLRAVEINGSNQVLRTSLGMVLQALGEPQRALQLFNRAVESSHCRALALFQKACILSSQKQHVKAADELVKARCLAPREPCIHVQMGRVQLGLGNVRKALQHFTHAMDLCAASGDRQLIAAAEEELRNALPAEARSTRSLTSALSDAGE